MTNLQKVLQATYRSAFDARNEAMGEVGRALYALRRARLRATEAQSWLEMVGDEWIASGDDRAGDYLERVWPMIKPDEYVWNPNAAVTG